MAGKSSKYKKQASAQAKRETRRIRILQIAFILFSIILILSIVLSLANS